MKFGPACVVNFKEKKDIVSFIHKEYLSLLSNFIEKVYFDVPVMKGPTWYSLKKDLQMFISSTSICRHIIFLDIYK